MAAGGDEAQRSAEQLRRDRRRRWLLSGTVIAFAVFGVWLTAATDRRDAAVLFVGLPALLAFGIAWMPRPRSLHGAVTAGTIFALLLASMLLQEGAICVLLTTPLVVAVAITVAYATRYVRERRQVLVVIPLLAIASLEGLFPSWRVAPVQTVTVAEVVDVDAGTVADRLAQGPDFTDARRPLLLRTGFPLPAEADGDGLEVGDRWTFDYRGAPIVTEVTSRSDDEATFRLVHDGSKTARWLTWRSATLRWDDIDGGTQVTIAVTFERGLDPSWWFGPVEDRFVRGGAAYLLDALVGDLTVEAADDLASDLAGEPTADPREAGA